MKGTSLCGISQMIRELIQVCLLLCNLLLELHELLLLTLTDSIILRGLFSLGECVTIVKEKLSANALPKYDCEIGITAYPWTVPPDRGAPVSPPAIARTEVENAARDWRDDRKAGRTALEMD